MKKILILFIAIAFAFTLTGCGNKNVYKVGATPVPHAEILKHVQPLLKEQGYEFEIVEFTDYVLPNTALDDDEIIANFFQHIPYLENQITENGFDFTNVGAVHVEPIGLYTKKYDSLADLPSSLEIIISNSPTDRPRLFGVLEEAGLITINSDVTNADIIDTYVLDLADLFSSEKNITFIEVDSALLYTNYNNAEGDAVLINGNYALDNGLNPLEDAIAIEGSASLYVNILVCQTSNVDDPFIQALITTLQSNDVQKWIEKTYQGSVVPAA